MARAKMIKEVEVKFSPAFEKAINGVKTTKKVKAKTKAAVKTKTKKRKATVKTKTPKVTGPKVPRGYKITKVERELTLSGVKDTYELYELTSKYMDGPKYFVSYDYALKAIEAVDFEVVSQRALAGKGYGGTMARGVFAEQRDLNARNELYEGNIEASDKPTKIINEDIDA